MPNISVIIPTWNSAMTLRDCIESCLNQTIQPLEVLVCDDGSTDNSRDIVALFSNPQVRWIAGGHSGTPAVPRNRGIAAAQGEWLAFCDSDDTWLPEKLEKQLNAIDKKSDLVCTNAYRKVAGTTTAELVSRWKKRKISFTELLKGNTIICSSVLIKRSLCVKIGGFIEDVVYAGFEDYIYWLRALTETTATIVPEALVIYDDHPESSVRSRLRSGALVKKKVLAATVLWLQQHRQYKYLVQLHLYIALLSCKAIIRKILSYAQKNNQ